MDAPEWGRSPGRSSLRLALCAKSVQAAKEQSNILCDRQKIVAVHALVFSELVVCADTTSVYLRVF
jgi:hypothetical protein